MQCHLAQLGRKGRPSPHSDKEPGLERVSPSACLPVHAATPSAGAVHKKRHDSAPEPGSLGLLVSPEQPLLVNPASTAQHGWSAEQPLVLPVLVQSVLPALPVRPAVYVPSAQH